MYNEKNNTKNTICPKKRNPSWGLIHPPTSEFFSDFWNLFNLTKPLNDNIYYLDDYVQVAYYCCWNQSSQTCTFSFYT